jgi:hypothetical protein
MKTLFTLILSTLIIGTSIAKQNDIETKSVEINNLISFVVDNYDAEDLEDRNITFLIQTKNDQVDGENLVMLRQSFKLISERLSENSTLSLVTYNKINGIALPTTSAKEEKLILHTLTDLKGSIAEFYSDGIALGYQHAEQNYNDTMQNIVVMIRMSIKAESDIVDISKDEQNAKKLKKKQKTNALLITALALLPELINVIKD